MRRGSPGRPLVVVDEQAARGARLQVGDQITLSLLGREIDGGRNRTLGTILGAAGGGLLGREIDRGGLKGR